RHDIMLMAGFVGAMLAGGVPTILAYPTFKVDPQKYRQGLSGVTRNLGSRLVVLDQQFPSDLLASIAGARVVRIDDETLAVRSERRSQVEVTGDDIAFIQHSAGTTGLQKGVALSHRSVLNQLEHLATALSLTTDDRIVSWLPLYHDMGLIACFILPLVSHIQVVTESPSDWVLQPVSMLRLATTHKCTLCWLPNFALQFMARRVPRDQRQNIDLSSMRAIINCSEPVRAQSLEEFYSAYRSTGLSRSALHSSYAMAENTFAVTQSSINGGAPPPVVWADAEIFRRSRRVEPVSREDPNAVGFVSSGTCLSGNSVRIVAEDGRDLPEGWLGEILVSSDSMFRGYYNRPDLTNRTLRDGWYATGDVGFLVGLDLYVMGRKDDMIIVAGRNLYPHDIEEIVGRHPAIHDGRAVAFGVESELGTQEVVVIAEVNSEADLEHRGRLETEIRSAIIGELDVAPRIVYLVPPKWMVKSTAGKPARSTNREKFLLSRGGKVSVERPNQVSHGS